MAPTSIIVVNYLQMKILSLGTLAIRAALICDTATSLTSTIGTREFGNPSILPFSIFSIKVIEKLLNGTIDGPRMRGGFNRTISVLKES